MIDERYFSTIDLNLMLTFMVIYREQNLTRAASKLSVKQPALSGSLVRLRAIFGDQLFVRKARGMRPTEHAHAIAKKLDPAIQGIQSLIAASKNQPSDTD